MEIETADGSIARYRTIGDVMNEGFLLSPVLSDRWDFLDLATTDWQQKLASKRVTRFRVVNQGFNSWLYPPAYQFSLARLQFPRQDFGDIASWQDWNDRLTLKPADGQLQKIAFDDGDRFIWTAHAPVNLQVAIPKDRQSFSFSFGILPEGVAAAVKENAGDGVEFKIIALMPDGREQTVFARKLQPASNPQDRGIHQAAIDISQIDATRFVMQTLPGKNNLWDWSYWSDLKAE